MDMKKGIFLFSFCSSYISARVSSFSINIRKVKILWEGHKILIYLQSKSNEWEIFFLILWPSKNIWTFWWSESSFYQVSFIFVLPYAHSHVLVIPIHEKSISNHLLSLWMCTSVFYWLSSVNGKWSWAFSWLISGH